MKNQPLVSIITPSYNSEKYIGETIKSVLNQSYINWELVIVDDCSTDKTWDIIRGYALKDSRIKIHKNEVNSGSGITRNRAIDIARGRYIAFIDSDDIWHKNKLSVQIAFMKENNYCFSHTSFGYIDEFSNKIKHTFRVKKSPVDYKHLLKYTDIGCLTAVFDCSVIGKFYMSEHRRKQDYALWLTILKTGVVSYPIDIELAYYRQSKNSATSNKWSLISKHVVFLMDTQGMNIFASIYYTVYWMMNGFMRYYVK